MLAEVVPTETVPLFTVFLQIVLFVQLLCLVHVEILQRLVDKTFRATLALLRPFKSYNEIKKQRSALKVGAWEELTFSVSMVWQNFLIRLHRIPYEAYNLGQQWQQEPPDEASLNPTASISEPRASAFRERGAPLPKADKSGAREKSTSIMSLPVAESLKIHATPTISSAEKKRWSWNGSDWRLQRR